MDDPDYVVNDSDLELICDSDYSDADSEDLGVELQDIITDTGGEGTTEITFLQDLLQCLRELKKGKIDWMEMDVNDLLNKFLKNPQECMKLNHNELNLIGTLIQTYTGIKVFNVSDLKAVKINKLLANLQTASHELMMTLKRSCQPKKVKTLQQLTRIPVMQPIYSKEYLQIVVTNTMFESAAEQWLNKSPVPMEIRVNQEDGDFFSNMNIGASILGTHLQTCIV